MQPATTYDKNRLRDYSSLFSRQEVSRWLKQDWSSIRHKINRYDQAEIKSSSSYLSYLKKIYRILENHYPSEYVYKNEFICQALLEEIRSGHSILFNEFRLGKAVADLAIFNGISKAYEVKTLLDNETKLSHQLSHYRRLFNEVWLIVPQQKFELYSKHDEKAGIIVYDHENGNFSIERKALTNAEVDIEILMQVLHTREYLWFVEQYYDELPMLNDFNKFKICKELISQIPSESLSRLFTTAMKQRRIHNVFSKRDPQFNQLFLSMNYSILEQQQLLSNLRTNIC